MPSIAGYGTFADLNATFYYCVTLWLVLRNNTPIENKTEMVWKKIIEKLGQPKNL